MTRTILHIDMDAFFASVEQLDDPSLRGKPVLVGGAARRGVVAAASYEARKFGARSAMPMAEALRKCPQAVVVTPRRDRYVEVSDHVFGIFRRYTPLVEGLSIDEAFLDVTASRALFGDGEAIARRIREDVKRETGLTCSAGVAACKFVAKIASDMNKPDGLTIAPSTDADVAAFLAPLPIERMWGIGPKTAPTLRMLGYKTFGDLAKARDGQYDEYRALARGIDDREVIAEHDAKSISAETTYDVDLADRETIARSLLSHAQRVAERLTESGLGARAVQVKLKYADFTILTRRKTLDEPACDTRTIHAAAVELLARFPLDRGSRVRLTGVAAQDLGPASGRQPTLFPDESAAKRRTLETVLSAARGRFGGQPITFATLLEDVTPKADAGTSSLRAPKSPKSAGGE